MTVKLPERAGFVPTIQEWDALVRIAENLAAQLAQAQASAVETARIVGADRDAARAEVARLTAVLTALINQADVAWATLDHTENERFVSRLGDAIDNARMALRQPAPALGQE